MNTPSSKSLFEIMAYSSLMVVINFIAAFIIDILAGFPFSLHTATTLIIPEFGILLIIGACLLARQPIEIENRTDPEGNPVPAEKYAQIGIKMLIASVILFLYLVLFTLINSLL